MIHPALRLVLIDILLALTVSEVRKDYDRWAATATKAEEADVIQTSINFVTDPANLISPVTHMAKTVAGLTSLVCGLT